MKTSNILLIIAGIVLFGTLTAYDFALKAEYNKGTYKNAFRNYSKLSYKDFDKIEINPASNIIVNIIYSDTFDVSVENYVKDYLNIKQEGSKLIVDFNSKELQHVSFGQPLIIKCPLIKEVAINTIFTSNGKQVTISDAPRNYSENIGVSIRGFKQDSILLVMNNASVMSLKNNKFNYVKAILGSGSTGESSLNINKSNQINFADINLENKSKLSLSDIIIEHPNFKISDSAQVNLSGSSLKLLRKYPEE
jgi:hypothetical protein